MEEQLVVLVDPWRDKIKYDRLLEAHDKLQRLNQNLEEKLLKLAENHHAESTRLSHQVQELTQRLVEARLYIQQLEDENDRYRSDITNVVQLLHCKPSNFVSPKLDTLPEDLQRKVLGQRNGAGCRKEKKIIKVQVPTFPPDINIMYAVDKGKGKKNGEKDIVSAAIMAKVLQERENERKENRKNRCKCASHIVLPTVDSDSQTLPVCTISYSDFNFSEFEEHEDEEDNDEEDNEEEEDVDEDVYEVKNASSRPSTSSYSSVASKFSSDDPPQSRICTTVDDIMKPDQKEEELLPTPLFRRKELKDNFTMNKGALGEDHFLQHESFPSPSSLSSASPVSSSDMAHSSGTEGANYSEGMVPRGCSSNSYSSSSNRKLPGRPVSMNFHKERERTWDKLSSAESYRNESSYRNGLVSHWRTTVLVHHPPKSHSYEPLSLMSTTTTSYGEGGHQQTTFAASAGSNELLMDSPSDERESLLNSYSNINVPIHSSQVTPSAQYYRAQKRTFWTRSSSTTSTETEI